MCENHQFRRYPLTPELELLWQEMHHIRSHPLFWEAIEMIDPHLKNAYAKLMFIPRRWLADGRENQVKDAMNAINAAIRNIERE